MIARLAFALLLSGFALAAAAQQFGAAQFPIKDDDGDPISNHALTVEQMAAVAQLPGLVAAGGKGSTATLYQFYDLNCPFCREAARDVDALIRSDPALNLVFVPYPVLSVQSIEGVRVELALRELAPPETFLEFHRRIYAGRGVIDGARALAVIRELGIDQQKLIAAANKPHITRTMKAHADLGSELGLMATPAYVIAGIAILGHPGLDPLRKVVAAVRACGKAVC